MSGPVFIGSGAYCRCNAFSVPVMTHFSLDLKPVLHNVDTDFCVTCTGCIVHYTGSGASVLL